MRKTASLKTNGEECKRRRGLKVNGDESNVMLKAGGGGKDRCVKSVWLEGNWRMLWSLSARDLR